MEKIKYIRKALEWVSFDSRMERLVGNGAALETIAVGFRFLEGPVWLDSQKRLYFSDIPGNGIYTWDERSGVTLFKPNSYLANGNTLLEDRYLLTCEHGTSRVTKTDLTDLTYTVLADRYEGKELNSPNDIIADKDGNIYFTDPEAGRAPRVGIPRPRQLDFQGVYRIDRRTAAVSLVEKNMTFPNGLCFSPDGKTLYVNDSREAQILAFDLEDKGGLINRRVFASFQYDGPGVLDGMKCRSDGYIFCTGPKGLYVLDSTGNLLGRIFTPEVTANFTFGETENEIYLTATSSLYRIQLAG